jgi:fructose-1,6-bisphosphatase II
MVTLDKPRLQNAIAEATQLGVKVFALPDGDVAASVLTCLQDNPYDLMYTTGGAPEGVISACAVKALGGDMQAELKRKGRVLRTVGSPCRSTAAVRR